MARTDNETRVTASVLQRLLELESEAGRRPVRAPTQSLRDLKVSVCKDLENLLNTRRVRRELLGGDKEAVREAVEDLVEARLAQQELPPDAAEADDSLLAYGLPDLTVFNLRDDKHLDKITDALEKTIELFEPRLLGAKAVPELARDGEHILRFRIDARLKVEPVAERVSFNTSLQPHNGQFKVESE